MFAEHTYIYNISQLQYTIALFYGHYSPPPQSYPAALNIIMSDGPYRGFPHEAVPGHCSKGYEECLKAYYNT